VDADTCTRFAFNFEWSEVLRQHPMMFSVSPASAKSHPGVMSEVPIDGGRISIARLCRSLQMVEYHWPTFYRVLPLHP
jgi:hypothetical protein